MNIKQILSNWAQAWKKENLNEDQLRLIAQANFDLYNGTTSEEDYPGFTVACNKIKTVLDNIPSEIYINCEDEMVSETEPKLNEYKECENCGGVCCEKCDGYGEIEFIYYNSEDWYKVSRSEIKNALFGELDKYLTMY